MGVALATYCGQNRGAARAAADPLQAIHFLDRIRYGILSSLGMLLVYCAFCVTVLWPFSWDITAWFVGYGQTDILAHSQHFMRVTSLCYPVLGVLVIFRYSLQSIGFTKVAMMSGVSFWCRPSVSPACAGVTLLRGWLPTFSWFPPSCWF